MTLLEDEIRRTLTRLDTLDIPVEPLALVQTAARRRRRRRGLAAVAAVAAVAAIVAGTAVSLHAVTAGDDGVRRLPQQQPTPVGPPLADWQRVGAVPLSHRNPGIVADVAGQLLVLGGAELQYCPPEALGCTSRPVGGGAVYDPGAGTWTGIATPPTSLRRSVVHAQQYAVDGTRLVLLSGTFPLTVVTYDIHAQAWRSYAPPPVELRGNDLIAAGGGYAYVADQDDHDGGTASQLMRLDLTSGRWTELPPSPHLPRLTVRAAFVTPDGPLVAGLYGLDPDAHHYRAEVERYADGRWQRFPDPHLQAAGYEFRWTGGRLVAPFLFHGGPGGALDPQTGTWTTLPAQPYAGGRGWQVGSSAGGSLVMQDGLVFDLTTRGSRYLARPHGAAKVATGGFVGRDLYVVDARSRLWRLRL